MGQRKGSERPPELSVFLPIPDHLAFCTAFALPNIPFGQPPQQPSSFPSVPFLLFLPKHYNFSFLFSLRLCCFFFYPLHTPIDPFPPFLYYPSFFFILSSLYSSPISYSPCPFSFLLPMSSKILSPPSFITRHPPPFLPSMSHRVTQLSPFPHTIFPNTSHTKLTHL